MDSFVPNNPIAELNDEETERLHADGPRTVVEYQVAWAKTYLKNYGYLENSARGIWTLTENGYSEDIASKDEITAFVRKKSRLTDHVPDAYTKNDNQNNEDSSDWIENLTEKMLSLSPEGFERLCQRIFRENGFVKVDVTGRTGDGGIDGIGILKLSLMSFKVLFQCKRYKGSVGAGDIRNFRGAMSGNADKGIFLTTGHFTKSAKEEASRPGAEPIELIDGVDLCNLLKEINLGIKTKQVIIVDDEWFSEFM